MTEAPFSLSTPSILSSVSLISSSSLIRLDHALHILTISTKTSFSRSHCKHPQNCLALPPLESLRSCLQNFSPSYFVTFHFLRRFLRAPGNEPAETQRTRRRGYPFSRIGSSDSSSSRIARGIYLHSLHPTHINQVLL